MIIIANMFMLAVTIALLAISAWLLISATIKTIKFFKRPKTRVKRNGRTVTRKHFTYDDIEVYRCDNCGTIGWSVLDYCVECGGIFSDPFLKGESDET